MSLADSVAKLALIDPHHANAVVDPKPSFLGGYPLPGPQSISGTDVMNKAAFVDENTWRILAEHGHFDDIVVGSGFCALAYITTALERNPNRKILLLERGGFWLPDHVQNLPAPFQFVGGHRSETFPWELAHATARKGNYLSGSAPFFGGRSSLWSIWSPRAIGDANGDANDLMRDFPQVVKNAARGFYGKAETEVLHVETADAIADPVFKAIPLQGRITHHLDSNRVAGEFTPESAKLATGRPLFGPASKGYRHFSVIASLLTLNDVQNTRAERKEGSPIMIATDTVVERFEVEETTATVPAHARILHTSRGPLTLHGGKTNVILAAGAIPNTTILLNSIKDKNFQRHAGQRLTAHFRSKVMARFRPDQAWFGDAGWIEHQALEQLAATSVHPVISAHHVRGIFPHDGANLQWHIQLHGIYVPRRWEHHVQELQGMVPDLWSAPTDQQLEGCGGYLVLSASVLGELPEVPETAVPGGEAAAAREIRENGDRRNRSHLEFIKDGDATKNIRLHLTLGDAADALWGEMVNRTFNTLRDVAGPSNAEPGTPDRIRRESVEFWNRTTKKWEVNLLPTRANHSKTNKPLFHEASTTYMIDAFPDEEYPLNPVDRATVDRSYRPWGLEEGNVYVTGAGLFPTAGSWNPTPTICALAQDLATTLVADTYLGRAAFNKHGTNQTWFFNGVKYIKVTVAAYIDNQNTIANNIVYGPHEIFYEWKSLWQADFRQIDAMVPVPGTDNREAYVFSGTKYARIKDNFQELFQAPLPIRGNWASLTGKFAEALCGALIDRANAHRMFFFSGDQYVHVQWNAAAGGDTVVDGGAIANISTRWPTIPEGRKFNTIFPDPTASDFAYLFSGTTYWRINIRNPDQSVAGHTGDVATAWPSLRKARFI